MPRKEPSPKSADQFVSTYEQAVDLEKHRVLMGFIIISATVILLIMLALSGVFIVKFASGEIDGSFSDFGTIISHITSVISVAVGTK